MTFEGQAPMELEMSINESHDDIYDYEILLNEDVKEFHISFDPLIRQVVDDFMIKKSISSISCRFHNTIAELIVDMCEKIRAEAAIDLVALSGGVFQNLYLVNRTAETLEKQGFRVLTNQQIPPNDGGISLGQAVIARRACQAE
jgi:hydrogenase maturation protein HypF